MKSFITKGILPLLLLGTITWLGQYIFIVDGSIDWFRFMLVYGVPIGIPYMFIIIPSRWDLSGTVGMAAMSVIIGAVFGFIVAIGDCSTSSLVCNYISSECFNTKGAK